MMGAPFENVPLSRPSHRLDLTLRQGEAMRVVRDHLADLALVRAKGIALGRLVSWFEQEVAGLTFVFSWLIASASGDRRPHHVFCDANVEVPSSGERQSCRPPVISVRFTAPGNEQEAGSILADEFGKTVCRPGLGDALGGTGITQAQMDRLRRHS